MPDKTPASKRFRPPSSTPVRRSQFSTAPLSSSSSASRSRLTAVHNHGAISSPFARPKSRQGHSESDEIEVDNEHATHYLLQNRRPVYPAIGFSKIDTIEDDGNVQTPQSQHENTVMANDGENDVMDDELSSPVAKRQRRQQLSVEALATDIFPSQHYDIPEDFHPVQSDGEYSEGDHSLSSIDEGEKPKHKFRIPKIFKVSDNKNKLAVNFRPNFQGAHGTVMLPADTALPDSFSPSKRRGKQDYLFGGAAETVRSWVLDLANDETQRGVHEVDQVKIQDSSADVSGRFTIVKDADKQAWMLVHQQGRVPPTRAFSNLSRTTIRPRRSNAVWTVQSRLNDEINVAVLWSEEPPS